jgi:hypothetical protein
MWGIFVPALEKMGMRVRDFDWCAGRVARAAFVAYCSPSRSRCEAWASRAKEWAVESSHVASEYEGKDQDTQMNMSTTPSPLHICSI